MLIISLSIPLLAKQILAIIMLLGIFGGMIYLMKRKVDSKLKDFKKEGVEIIYSEIMCVRNRTAFNPLFQRSQYMNVSLTADELWIEPQSYGSAMNDIYKDLVHCIPRNGIRSTQVDRKKLVINFIDEFNTTVSLSLYPSSVDDFDWRLRGWL